MTPPPKPTRPEATPLDAQAVQRLHELDPDGRHGVVRRVLQTFQTSLQRQLDLAVAARDRGDAATVGNIAHMLKSSSASVGALALAGLCGDLERRVRAGGAVDLVVEVENLLTEGARALAAVTAMLEP